ncbi:MAG: cysteine desulfurase [Bradymonadales bacterium]|nr:MAG: cysteine desulfurase [Bradymonadales bacterium]
MIYWDYNATAPLHPHIKEKVIEALHRYDGNPSSIHRPGQEARAYLETVRRRLAEKLGVLPTEVVFCGSATEANMLGLWGFWLTEKKKSKPRKKLVSSSIEHAAVTKNVEFLAENEGVESVELPLLPSGLADLEALEKILSGGDVFLCSLQGASNETGIVQDWQAVAALCARYETAFHSDMVQVFGRGPLSLKQEGLNSASLAFHKSGGLKAIGALYLKTGSDWESCICGGGQEKKRRAGTENLLGVASVDGLLDVLDQAVQEYQGRIREVRDHFESELKALSSQIKIVGEELTRLPNTSTCIFPGVASDALLMSLDVNNICASAGSACSSGMSMASPALLSLGYSEDEARSAIRFSLGESSEMSQVPKVIEVIQKTLRKFAA